MCRLPGCVCRFTDRWLRTVRSIARCYINIYCKLTSPLTDRLLLLSTVLRDDGTVAVLVVRSDEPLRHSCSAAPSLSRFTASPPPTRWRAVSVMWLHFRRSSLSSADVGEHRWRSRWHRCSVDDVPAHTAHYSRFNAIKRLTVTYCVIWQNERVKYKLLWFSLLTNLNISTTWFLFNLVTTHVIHLWSLLLVHLPGPLCKSLIAFFGMLHLVYGTNSPLIFASLVRYSLLHFHLSHMAVHHLHRLHCHHLHLLSLVQSFILNLRLGFISSIGLFLSYRTDSTDSRII